MRSWNGAGLDDRVYAYGGPNGSFDPNLFPLQGAARRDFCSVMFVELNCATFLCESGRPRTE
jgi:hypothetical protein